MKNRPNIIYILADDMGYGDVSCLNPEGKIQTPNIDRIAKEGICLTDAHATSSVCSPSRYSILTGRYNWRSTLQEGIVRPYGNCIIDDERITVQKFLKENGYQTACIGKWHLGMSWDFEITDEFLPNVMYNMTYEQKDFESTEDQKRIWNEHFSKPVLSGPLKTGFDYYFGVDIPNWPPYCFIEQDRALGIPSEWLQPHLLGNHMASLQGPAMPYWNFEQLLPTFISKISKYIEEKADDEKPFFLYFPITSPHTPLAVNKKWIGKSGLNNLYADFVMETDDIVGQLLNTLDEKGIAENTMVIFASDNGCAHYIGTSQMEQQGHYSSAYFRGYKSDIWDGGHRIPLAIRWPDGIAEGTVCDSLVCLSDFYATVADLLEIEIPENTAEDSFSMKALFKNPDGTIRDYVVHHSITGKFAIRNSEWKLVLCPGSGGWTMDDLQALKDGYPEIQLYNMMTDPAEQENLYKKEPNIVRNLLQQLIKIVENGRSTEGIKVHNDVTVDIWKNDQIRAFGKKIFDDL